MTPYERERVLALAQKWREDAEDRKDGGYNEWANARLLSADELTALADKLGPEQAQDEVERLRWILNERASQAIEHVATINRLNAELSRLRGLLGEFVSILQINETPYGKGVSIPTSIDGLLSLVERAEAALKDQQP